MRKVTLKQWQKMPERSRDWLLKQAIGSWFCVYWHVELNGKIVSGSYETEERARAVLAYKPNKYSAAAYVRRSLCYLNYTGDAMNPAHSLIQEMQRRGFICRLEYFPAPSLSCIAKFMKIPDGKQFHFYEAKTMQEAIGAAALQALGFMDPYPF